MVGFISDRYDLKTAFLVICIGTWLLCGLFLVFVARVVPKDIAQLRGLMRQRANHERELQEAS
jgi:hypothetical protein